MKDNHALVDRICSLAGKRAALAEASELRLMKKQPKKRASGSQPVQYFTFGPWEFNIDHAMILARNAEKYQPLSRRPSPDWVGPNIDIDESHVERASLDQPVIFATVIQNGEPWPLLIDGHHRVLRALRQHVPIQTITLDLADTLRILKAPGHTIEQMRRDGQELGLLSP
jgi:hypothetical protein